MSIPRVLIAGLRGGSGKTLISLGIAAAWNKQGRHVAPFKKGPDYIDASWLTMAAGRPCRNLDLYLMSPRAAERSFITTASNADVSVIEGNRGLYDGMDAQGTFSSAELAKLLKTPVILTIDCTKSTRTIAAIVLGCQQLDPEVPLRGVILNRTASPRHESVLRDAVQQVCNLPVLGAVRRIRDPLFPERHLGLVPPQETDQLTRAIDQAADVAEKYLDLDAIWNVANDVPPLEPNLGPATPEVAPPAEAVRIGVFRDAAFQFYYPENLEALAREGARLIEISPMREEELPNVDALYIGGGFPETLAPALSENQRFNDSLRRRVERGLPIYAECGGAVYLGQKLIYEEKHYPMAGVLPAVFAFQKKPQGHGYVEIESVKSTPFYDAGEKIRGHEFHYTYMQSATADDLTFAFRVHRGHGFDGQQDGLCRHNVLALYTHVHALGTESWAPALVQAAARFRSGL